MANLENARFISEILGKFALDLLDKHRKTDAIPTLPSSSNPTLSLPILVDIEDVRDYQRLAGLVGTGHHVVLALGSSELKLARYSADPGRAGSIAKPVFLIVAEGILSRDDALHNLVFKPVVKTL